eukprot:TRINITY_DN10675_c0_g2_i1.p1 TRINITY_DN10675_c0_g2~~TRINITY_DN10675_c0_g2_i1.p1  ORF type:complete len:621 (+),score=99.31 TRINITY_DN10675_c0_g2_i1:100-1962(+)
MSRDLSDMEGQVKNLAEYDGKPRFCYWEAGNNGQGTERKISAKDMIGGGAYGMVTKCWDRKWERWVAVKRIDWTTIEKEVRRVIREVQILKHLRHPNLIHLIGLYTSKSEGGGNWRIDDPFNLFIACELMDMPLSQVIQNQADTWNSCQRGQYGIEHVIWLVHQLLHGLHGMHSAKIVHRDIKPHNILVNLKDTTLRICDFGLSRTSQPSRHISHYVVTRYYRAPEIVFGLTSVDPSIDIWSAACVSAELLIGEPLFAINTTMTDGRYNGTEASRALLHLLNRLGKPDQEDIDAVQHDNVKQYLSKIKPSHLAKGTIDRDIVQYIRDNLRVGPLSHTSHTKEEELEQQKKLSMMLNLVDCMLQFNPKKRPTALHLLQQELFSFSTVELIKSCPVFDIPDPVDTEGFDVRTGIEVLRKELAEDIPDVKWWDEDEDEEQSVIMRFITLTASGSSPDKALWSQLLRHRFDILAGALQTLGVSPELDVLISLTPDQLRQLSTQVGCVMQEEALLYLNSLREDPDPTVVSLIPAPVTLRNLNELQPIIYQRLSQLEDPGSDVAEAIRINLDFLITSTTAIPKPPSPVSGSQEEVDWTYETQDDCQEDYLQDWIERDVTMQSMMDE